MPLGAAYESWINSETIINGVNVGSSWDIVKIGEKNLPGVCTVENMEIGRDIDVQKRKKEEKARIKDNGLSLVTFNITVELTGAQWFIWSTDTMPYLMPKEGVPRTKFPIVHPMVNAFGVADIYIHKIKIDAPSPRKGMKVEIHVGEWIDDPVPTVVKKTADVAQDNAPARQVAVDNIMNQTFPDSPQPKGPTPEELGYGPPDLIRGYR